MANIESITLNLGALCDPISKQLAGLASQKELARLDKMADAIVMCAVHGLLSDSEIHRARTKLVKKAAKIVAAAAK